MRLLTFRSRSVAEPEVYESYLDGLRGIAILMVVFFHSSLGVDSISYFDNFKSVAEHFSRGVQLFFMLSAFTLFRSSWIRSLKKSFSSRDFFIRRAFRILPIWWLAVWLYSTFWYPGQTREEILAMTFFYFGFYKDAFVMTFIPVGWSLFVEESFYVFFPFFNRYIKNIKKALIALIVGVCVAILWLKYFRLFSLSPTFAGIFPLFNYFAFFLGITLFFIRKDFIKDFDIESKDAKIYFFDFLAVAGFIAMFSNDRIMGTFLMAPLIFSSFFQNTLTGRLTRNKFLGKFGTYCYSIYLFHSPVSGYLFPYQLPLFDTLGVSSQLHEVKTIVWFIPVSLVSLIIGAISFHFFELTFVNLGKRVINKLNGSQAE